MQWRRGGIGQGRPYFGCEIAGFTRDSSGFFHYQKLFSHYELLAILLAVVSYQTRLPTRGGVGTKRSQERVLLEFRHNVLLGTLAA
jgi:hypothetical protein